MTDGEKLNLLHNLIFWTATDNQSVWKKHTSASICIWDWNKRAVAATLKEINDVKHAVNVDLELFT
jgi:hypothetical protein